MHFSNSICRKLYILLFSDMIDQKIHSWKNHCCFLSEEDREDPFELMFEWCDQSFLTEQRESLFELFRIALESREWMMNDPQERASEFWRLLQTIKLMEACYLIYAAHETGNLTYSYVRK